MILSSYIFLPQLRLKTMYIIKGELEREIIDHIKNFISTATDCKHEIYTAGDDNKYIIIDFHIVDNMYRLVISYVLITMYLSNGDSLYLKYLELAISRTINNLKLGVI
jgi:hypothetical protein